MDISIQRLYLTVFHIVIGSYTLIKHKKNKSAIQKQDLPGEKSNWSLMAQHMQINSQIPVCTAFNAIKFMIKGSYACSDEVCTENTIFKPLGAVY